MFNIGGGELLIIFLVALVVLGPTKLPEAARQLGKWVGEFLSLIHISDPRDQRGSRMPSSA